MSQLLREFVSVLLEDAVAQHCRYERLVIKTLRSAGVGGKIRQANCTDSLLPDADIKVDGEIHYVEVKASELARMGSTSVGYNHAERRFFESGLNRELSSLIANVLNEMQDTSLLRGIDRLIRFLRPRAPMPKGLQGFPMSGFRSEDWRAAREAGVLQAINRRFNGDVDLIAQHYGRKNTYYIQIGGWGLYTIGSENPANLPVPRLSGKVVLELEAKKSGDIPGRAASKAAFRVHARLQPEGPSPYTLDDPESIKALLAARGDSA